MSSKALLNVLTSVALVEAIVGSMKPTSKTAEELTEKVVDATQAALRAWPGEIDKKGMAAMASRLGKFEAKYGGAKDASLYTSIGLGILEDLYRRISEKKRRSAILDVIAALFRVHKYYDRSLKRVDLYEEATVAVALWHRLGAE